MDRIVTGRLHRIARSPDLKLVITDHAAKRMKARDITRFEVEKVLKAGAVVMTEPTPQGREKWRVAGHDTDGQPIELVVEVLPRSLIVLITVIRVG